MMNDVEIKQAVRGFLAENFMYRGSVADVADDASLIKAGILDSVGILALISFLEERFEIQVTDDEVEPENLESLDTITAFIERKTGAS
jgi:acyl carrier protein